MESRLKDYQREMLNEKTKALGWKWDEFAHGLEIRSGETVLISDYDFYLVNAFLNGALEGRKED
jgi:hypothetical protein